MDILVIIGPSAAGKSTVVGELHRRGVIRVHPTWTTRPPRADEADGCLEHRFVSDAVFDDLTSGGFFLGTVEMFGLPYRYGLPPLPALPGKEAGGVVTVMLRAEVVARFTALFPHSVVYQVEDDLQRTRTRLVERGCSADETAARLDACPGEMDLGRRIARRVFVNDRPVAALADDIVSSLHQDGVMA